MGVKLSIWLLSLGLAITCALSVQMGHASPFYTYKFQEFFNDIRNCSIQWVLTRAIAFWRFGNLLIHQDSNSQSGSSLGSVKVHSLTLSYIPGSMKCDFWAPFLARTLANPCFGREPKVRVVTLTKKKTFWNLEKW